MSWMQAGYFLADDEWTRQRKDMNEIDSTLVEPEYIVSPPGGTPNPEVNDSIHFGRDRKNHEQRNEHRGAADRA
jgi:hypothetical protein